jgi:CubicO group peptidase (beta-lactamase class C family)
MSRRLSEVLRAELERGVREGVFPAGAAAVAVGDEPAVAHESESGRIFDIASLTKPFVATLIHRLCARRALDIDRPVRALWPEVQDRPVAAETLRALLSHRAGLPPWLPLHRDHQGRAVVLAAAAATTDAPRPTYSDLGYLIVGEIAQRAAGEPLSAALSREVLEPLGLFSVRWGPVRPEETLPTGFCADRQRVVHGEVNDENAAAAGGIAGHAGLFAHVADVCRLGRAWLAALDGAEGALLPADVARRAVTPLQPGTHALGWDTTKPDGSSAGTLMGPRTFGHLGFTGCSLWVDPEARLVVALLTNRTHPTRDNVAIRTFRPAFHDAVVRAVRAG